MKKHLTEEQFLDYLDKRIMDAVKSYFELVGKEKALEAYKAIIKFCNSNNLSKNFVLLKMENLLSQEKNNKNNLTKSIK